MDKLFIHYGKKLRKYLIIKYVNFRYMNKSTDAINLNFFKI